MEWYSEGVANAITTCRQQNALFIVYIKDDSETSRTMDESWNCEEVQSVLTTNKYVALQIQKDSLEHKQFDQLFPVLLYPCVFCINAVSGQQLEVASGLQTPNQFRSILQNAFMKLSGNAPEQHNASAADQPSGSSELSPQEEGSVQPAKKESEPNLPAARRPERSVDELRQEVRKKRADSEKQKEKREELQRRQHGQDVADFRQEQEDRRNQAWILERRKQKEEERRAREEVRAKLEQDRQERLAQQQALKATTPTSDSAEVRQREFTRARTAGAKSSASSCRVQVKLPGGGSTVFSLAASDSLSLLRTKVAQHLKAAESKISLFATYPQRELSSEQDMESMTDLDLVPSAVVLAKLSKGMLSSGDGGGGSGGLLISLFQFLLQLLVMLKNGIVGLFSSPSATAQPQSYSTQSSNAARVRRFRQEDYDEDKDDDKKKSTYNGNSTQQQ